MNSNRMSRILYSFYVILLSLFSIQSEIIFKLFSICVSLCFSFPRNGKSISNFLSSRFFNEIKICVLITMSKKIKWDFVNSNEDDLSNDSDQISRILFLWFPFVAFLCSTMFKLFFICVSSQVPSQWKIIQLSFVFISDFFNSTFVF